MYDQCVLFGVVTNFLECRTGKVSRWLLFLEITFHINARSPMVLVILTVVNVN